MMNLQHSASASAAFAGYEEDMRGGQNQNHSHNHHHHHHHHHHSMTVTKQMNYALSRQRSFHARTSHSIQYSTSQHQQLLLHQTQGKENKRNSGMPLKKQPTMEIYRPPNVREEPRYGNIGRSSLDACTKLNVHAKEFTMSSSLPNSKSSGNLYQMMNNGSVSVSVTPQVNRLQHSKSSGNVLHNTSVYGQQQSPPLKVHFAAVEKKSDTNNNYSKSSYNHIQVTAQNGHLYNVPDHLRLKRSKSMNDALKKSTDIGDLGPLPSEIHSLIQKASLNPNDLSQRHLMSLAKFLVEKAVGSREYSNASAKICAAIIEKSRTETFVDSLFNTCQFIFKEREKLLRTAPSKYPAFMAFLYELFTQMKSREPKLKTTYDNIRTLTLIASCLLDFLNQGVMKVNSEVESFFFVFTSIGQDLEVHLPNKLNEIMDQMRIQFLKQTTSPSFRKTLLQMIELRASKWALPVESIIYYYPGNSQKK